MSGSDKLVTEYKVHLKKTNEQKKHSFFIYNMPPEALQMYVMYSYLNYTVKKALKMVADSVVTALFSYQREHPFTF